MPNGARTIPISIYEKVEELYKVAVALRQEVEPLAKKPKIKKLHKPKKRTWLKPGEMDPEYGVPYGSDEWWEITHKEALADIKAGRVKSFDSVEDLIADLHANS